MQFLQVHADYITFLYGLGYVILGCVAFLQRFLGGYRIRWFWMAAFGLLHGIHEWTDVVAFAHPGPELSVLAGLLGLASFVALLQFARENASSLEVPDGITETQILPSSEWRTLLIPLGVFLAGGVIILFGRQETAEIVSRMVALVAGVYAAFVISRIRECIEDRRQRSWLLLCGVAVLSYGLVEGFLEDALHASTATGESGSTEILFRAIQGLLAFSVMVSVWGYIDRGRRIEGGAAEGSVGVGHYTAWLAGSLVLVLGAGWYVTDQLGVAMTESVRDRSRASTEMLATHVRDEMARTDLMAELLAKSPFVMSGLQHLDDVNIADAEAAMRQHTAMVAGATAFLMKPNGRVVASTEQQDSSRRVGESFGFLPFFQDSAAYGLVGRDLAVEPDRVQRGYFVSHPVTWIDGRPIGTAVVKKLLAQADMSFRTYRNWFLVSPAGITFLASRPELSLKPLWPIAEATRQQLQRTGDFGPGPFLGSILPEKPVDRAVVFWEGRLGLVNIAPVRGDGWSAVIVESLEVVAARRLYGIIGTMAIALFALSFFVVLHREAAFEIRLAEDQQRLRSLNEALERQATTDALTGLHNRAKFNSLLLAELDRAKRYKSGFALVLFDVDFFKRINDNWGHQVGDSVLVNIARLGRDTARSSDSIARWGGEEFVAILPMTDRGGAVLFAQRLREALMRFSFEPVPKVTCSFGITEYCTADTMELLIHRADAALYLAKENGRDRVEVRLGGEINPAS